MKGNGNAMNYIYHCNGYKLYNIMVSKVSKVSFLIKSSRIKIFSYKTKLPSKCVFLPGNLSPGGVECMVNNHNNFICTES